MFRHATRQIDLIRLPLRRLILDRLAIAVPARNIGPNAVIRPFSHSTYASRTTSTFASAAPRSGASLPAGVASCAVIGLPDERLGSRVVAFVEPVSPAVNAETIDAACLKTGLARFKRPREYVFVKAIPRSASGKLLRRKLRIGEFERI